MDIHQKHTLLAKQSKEVEAMTDEKKGALLLECVQNIAFQSGASVDELTSLLVHYSGIKDGITAANETFYSL